MLLVFILPSLAGSMWAVWGYWSQWYCSNLAAPGTFSDAKNAKNLLSGAAVGILEIL